MLELKADLHILRARLEKYGTLKSIRKITFEIDYNEENVALDCKLDFERRRNERQGSESFLGEWIPFPSSAMKVSFVIFYYFGTCKIRTRKPCVISPHVEPLHDDTTCFVSLLRTLKASECNDPLPEPRMLKNI